MTVDFDQIHAYWERDDVESMYDKHLLQAEIDLIRPRISERSKVLDAGCGEGEGTLAYAGVPGVRITAVDFSATRLKKAAARVKGMDHVEFRHVDFLKPYRLDTDFDVVISQRFLINLPTWELQSKVLSDLAAFLKPGGRLLMLEGSRQGVDALNKFRAAWGLEPIPVKWHNLFFDDEQLVEYMRRSGFRLVEQDGLGTYFALTRGVRPVLDRQLNWDSAFNRVAASREMASLLGLGARFSRLKLWVFEK